MGDDFVWDDPTWDRVWDRVLAPVERHSIAMSVLRRRIPPDAFERRIAAELARRWARHAVVLAVAYALWTLFWGGIAWDLFRRSSPVLAVPVGCTAVGLVAVVACLAFRAWLRRGPDLA